VPRGASRLFAVFLSDLGPDADAPQH